jgi:hypothetical protein
LVTGNTFLAKTATPDKNPSFPLFFKANCLSGTNPISPLARMNVCVKDQSPQTADWSEKDSPHQTTEPEPPNRSLYLPLSLEQISLLLSFVPEFDSLKFDNIGQFLDSFDVCGFENGERSELRLAKSQWILAMSLPVGKGKGKEEEEEQYERDSQRQIQ